VAKLKHVKNGEGGDDTESAQHANGTYREEERNDV
jgi:hypothetical protein